jgi:hypothetical protein
VSCLVFVKFVKNTLIFFEIVRFWHYTQRCCVMESCDFVNEEFPEEIQKFAKEQQVLVYAKYSNFLYTVLATVIYNSYFNNKPTVLKFLNFCLLEIVKLFDSNLLKSD